MSPCGRRVIIQPGAFFQSRSLQTVRFGSLGTFSFLLKKMEITTCFVSFLVGMIMDQQHVETNGKKQQQKENEQSQYNPEAFTTVCQNPPPTTKKMHDFCKETLYRKNRSNFLGFKKCYRLKRL